MTESNLRISYPGHCNEYQGQSEADAKNARKTCYDKWHPYDATDNSSE